MLLAILIAYESRIDEPSLSMQPFFPGLAVFPQSLVLPGLYEFLGQLDCVIWRVPLLSDFVSKRRLSWPRRRWAWPGSRLQIRCGADICLRRSMAVTCHCLLRASRAPWRWNPKRTGRRSACSCGHSRRALFPSNGYLSMRLLCVLSFVVRPRVLYFRDVRSDPGRLMPCGDCLPVG